VNAGNHTVYKITIYEFIISIIDEILPKFDYTRQGYIKDTTTIAIGALSLKRVFEWLSKYHIQIFILF
jgi:hypothetical protein